METQTPDIGREVFATLKYIIDPEIGVNIVDLGLVYKVSLEGDQLNVELTLTTPGCPMSNTIIMASEQILHKRFPSLDVKVELVWSPVWTPDMISEEGLRQLEKN
ncbi:metal-sulfur cluster biosynthetic enzyme [Pontibacter ummariensis]|uniref:Metal-sulfur cluster biosynthetic enzyme n=1 Tax=Pontibacter ummariensis TaxID=1610492 RepID=A0A239LU51_9BACT|nr:metal-sulfur cluster assembly factor [Pontibacter ummariensis]PRY01222.1 metal-sulfur cluster biosynthetic enzyme [Pontibacter ummariensis]SNT33219.1 Metal-sulfur cluster biosynthetic enzyme [Pontibacter ummariensis]